MKNKSEKILLVLAIGFILIGSLIFLYPTISNYFAEKNHVEIIKKYDTITTQMDESNIEDEWQKAKVYNENLAGEPVHDPFVAGSGYALPKNYMDVLNITNDGTMASIEIPKIDVYLPIYHGTSEEVLEKGVGHIQTTSLPIGGISTHSVLTGHTGLPSSELFTRLDELQIGDIFYIHILKKILTYKIYETKVILPNQIDELQITNGEDLVTLVTCTPYGINTHRLLVKAKACEYEEYKKQGSSLNEDSGEKLDKKNYYLIGSIIGVVIIIVIFGMFVIFR